MSQISVLIVEDKEELRAMIVEYLSDFNLKIIACADGMSAYQKVQNQKFDLIITDIDLPKLSGDQFIKKTKANQNNSKTPILVTSGTLDIELLKDIKGHIKKAFVKPVQMQDLENEIRNIFGNQLQRKPQAAS